MPELRLAGGPLDGLELHYLAAGEGPVTVLVHGLGGFAESWRGTVAELARHGRVVALDLPGFGRSAKPRASYELSFLAEAVEGLLRAMGVARARVVGHSLGGGVAAALAVAHPERIERLVFVGATVPGFPLKPSFVYRMMALPGLGELMSSLVTRAVCAAALGRCLVEPKPDEVRFFVDHEYAVRASPEGRAAYLSALRAARTDFTRQAPTYRGVLTRLDRPVLVIHGRQDPVVPLDHAEAVFSTIPGAAARWLERCGHFPHIEHPAIVNDWLADFLYARASSR